MVNQQVVDDASAVPKARVRSDPCGVEEDEIAADRTCAGRLQIVDDDLLAVGRD